MRKHFARFMKNEDGAALVEYGLLVGLIAVVCIIAVTDLGKNVNVLFCDINQALKDNLPAAFSADITVCPVAG
jgi:pilus assembly protein Flp/PilA